MTTTSKFTIRAATIHDVALVRQFIADLADYEKLSDQVVVDEEALRAHLFGPRPSAEALLGFAGEHAAACAIFFQNFSTFLGRPGLYLEDLFVRPDYRGQGFGRAMLVQLARISHRPADFGDAASKRAL